ncbi:MAG: hypothetical protein K6F63_04985 [Lachnospiraceae bacterium]|nr:hypothetical protein [Lachnospiraceae bacterium]
MSDNNDKRIKEALESIEPAEGAKERMLANIKRKAAEQSETAREINSPEKMNMEENIKNVTVNASKESSENTVKVARINRIVRWAAPLAACLVLVLAGSLVIPRLLNNSGKTIGGNNVQIANPIVEVENADAIKNQLGLDIDAPKGAENVTYSVIMGQTGEVRFDLDGHNYTFRGSKETDIIIGLYGSEEKAEKLDTKKNAELTVLRSGEESYKMINWEDGKTKFVIANTDGASEDQIKAVFSKLN